MRLCSAVVNISHDMKFIYSKLFDGISKSNNYALSVIVADDGVKNLVVVAVKIVEIYAGSEEFFDDIRKSGVKRFAQPRTGSCFAPLRRKFSRIVLRCAFCSAVMRKLSTAF